MTLRLHFRYVGTDPTEIPNEKQILYIYLMSFFAKLCFYQTTPDSLLLLLVVVIGSNRKSSKKRLIIFVLSLNNVCLQRLSIPEEIME